MCNRCGDLGCQAPGSFAKYTAQTNETKKIKQMKVFGFATVRVSVETLSRQLHAGRRGITVTFAAEAIYIQWPGLSCKRKVGSREPSLLVNEPFLIRDTRYFP